MTSEDVTSIVVSLKRSGLASAINTHQPLHSQLLTPLMRKESTMQDNPNKETENPPLDAEDWELAFEAYEGNTHAALNMAFNLMAMKGYLSYDPPKIEEVDRRGSRRDRSRHRGSVSVHTVSSCVPRRVHEVNRRGDDSRGRRNVEEAGP